MLTPVLEAIPVLRIGRVLVYYDWDQMMHIAEYDVARRQVRMRCYGGKYIDVRSHNAWRLGKEGPVTCMSCLANT